MYLIQYLLVTANHRNESSMKIEMHKRINITDQSGLQLLVFDPGRLLFNTTSPKKYMRTPGSLNFTSLPTKMELLTPWTLLFTYMLRQQQSGDDSPEALRRTNIVAPTFVPSKLTRRGQSWLLSLAMTRRLSDRSSYFGFRSSFPLFVCFQRMKKLRLGLIVTNVAAMSFTCVPS